MPMNERGHEGDRSTGQGEGTFHLPTPPGAILWAALVALVVVACGGEYPQSTIDPRSDFAEVIHSLYVSIFWWSMVILAVVWGILAYILYRFRERPGGPEPRQTHGHLGLEVAWTIGPALIVVAIAIPSIQAVFATQRQHPPDADPLVVEVVGHRFWWEFRYPESGVVTANELHLPVDRPVSLQLSSADVIHSFWVPQLGGKRDANPLRAVPEGEELEYTWLHFTPNSEGVFLGQCAEYCGSAHSLMGVRVVVEDPEDFQRWQERWLEPRYTPAQWPGTGGGGEPAEEGGAGGEAREGAGSPAPTPPEGGPDAQEELVERGRQVFFEESYCVLCHGINGTSAAGGIGPDLTNFGERSTLGAGMLENTRENLERWIRDPSSIKPGVEMPGAAATAPRTGGGEWQATGLDEEQVRAVAAYLASLGAE